MAYLDLIRETRVLKDRFGEFAESTWITTFNDVLEGRVNTWDYPWMLTCWAQSGLTATPNVNLVSNIGFDSRGTHTQSRNHMAEIPTEAIGDVIHPTSVIRDAIADRFVSSEVLKIMPRPKRTLGQRVRGRLERFFT
jgi:hypothetical protein